MAVVNNENSPIKAMMAAFIPPPLPLEQDPSIRRSSSYARCKEHYQEGVDVISDEHSEIKVMMAGSIPPPLPLRQDPSIRRSSSYARCKDHYQEGVDVISDEEGSIKEVGEGKPATITITPDTARQASFYTRSKVDYLGSALEPAEESEGESEGEGIIVELAHDDDSEREDQGLTLAAIVAADDWDQR
jgi:hypothetical protein